MIYRKQMRQPLKIYLLLTCFMHVTSLQMFGWNRAHSVPSRNHVKSFSVQISLDLNFPNQITSLINLPAKCCVFIQYVNWITLPASLDLNHYQNDHHKKPTAYMCCDLARSVGSRQHWLWDTFYCFENLSIVITLEPLVWFRWGFQQNVPLLMRTSIK